jgi:hypothetical protein
VAKKTWSARLIDAMGYTAVAALALIVGFIGLMILVAIIAALSVSPPF